MIQKGLVPECVSKVLCCSLRTMCHVCVTAQLIFIKRETKNPEVQLECLVEQSIQSSRANLSVFVRMSPLRILSTNKPANRHKGELKKINKYTLKNLNHQSRNMHGTIWLTFTAQHNNLPVR